MLVLRGFIGALFVLLYFSGLQVENDKKYFFWTTSKR